MKLASISLVFAVFAALIYAAVLDTSDGRAVKSGNTGYQSVCKETIQQRVPDQAPRVGYYPNNVLARSVDHTKVGAELFVEAVNPLSLDSQGQHAKRDSFEGKRIKGNSDAAVYLVLDNKLRHISSPAVYEALFGPGDITYEEVPQPLVDVYAKGHSLDQRTPLVTGFDNTVYLIDEGKKRGITSPEVFNRYGFSWDKIVSIGSVTDLIPTGSVIS